MGEITQYSHAFIYNNKNSITSNFNLPRQNGAKKPTDHPQEIKFLNQTALNVVDQIETVNCSQNIPCSEL